MSHITKEVSHGKWEVTKWSQYEHTEVHVSVQDFSNMIFVANFGNPIPESLPTNPNAELNAEITCVAINACKSINNCNPLAVAQNIDKMYGELMAYHAIVGNTAFSIDREIAKKLYNETNKIFKDMGVI